MVVPVEEAGKLCLEVSGRIPERLQFFVAENTSVREQISVVDSSVMASEAEVGKVGDEAAGVVSRVTVLIVGEITGFGEVVLVWGSLCLLGEGAQILVINRTYCSGLFASSLGRLVYIAATLG